MRIAVCIKQVPVISRLQFDAVARRIVREGVTNEVNPFDVLALVRAVELRDQLGGEITVYTMGPPQARTALAYCLALGADHAVHLSDRAFAGADTLATARALALALSREQYDLVLFGLYSTDAETGQVGPEVAEMLGWPQVCGVRKLEVSSDGRTATVEREVDTGYEVIECDLPAVVSVRDGVAPELFPRRADIQAAEERDIPVLTASDLSSDMGLFGEQGSPTWVAEIEFVESNREQVVLEGVSPEDAAGQIVDYLKRMGLLGRVQRARPAGKRAPSAVRSVEGPGVWVLAELGPAGPHAVSYEMLGAVQEVADAVHGHVAAVLLGGIGVGTHAADLACGGADVVYVAEDDALANHDTDAYTDTLAAAMEAHQPYAVLIPSTVRGRDLAPRVAARLQLGLTGDCIGLSVDGEGQLVQMKPAFGGNVVAPILSKTKPYMATIRPGMLERLEPDEGRKAPVRQLSVPARGPHRVRLTAYHPQGQADAEEVQSAWAVVAVGMGLEGPENLPAIQPLLDVLGAALACTRDVVYAGWLPVQRQVGLSGRSVAPELYVTVGVRGDFNHLVGMQRSGAVVAINNNKRALIFRNADIGVVDTWQNVLPHLVAALKKEMGK